MLGMMEQANQLIIRKRSLDEKTAEEHAGRLADAVGQDSYQMRMALAGDGLSCLSKTNSIDLVKAGEVLSDLGYQWCLASPPKGRRHANTVRNFAAQEGRIEFEGKRGRATLQRGMVVIAVLAEMNGQLLNKLMRKSAYRKKGGAVLSDQEKYQEIFTSRIVLDLYFFEEGATPETIRTLVPLRFFPGKFNPASLGDQGTISAQQNIDRVIQLVKQYAGRLHLEMDFGLFQLPDCRLELSKEDAAQQANLAALMNYGWYLAHLHLQNSRPPVSQSGDRPAVLDALAGLSSVVGAFGSNKAEPGPGGELPELDDSLLPPPPFGRRRLGPVLSVSRVKISVAAGAFALAIACSAILVFFPNLTRLIFQYGINRGVLFFMAAAAAFFGAFYLLRMKRWMENTPTSKARSAAMGMVEIKGTAERKFALASPLTQASCVYYRIKKYQRQTLGDRKEWRLVDDSDSGPVPFYLRDETGTVVVEPDGASIRPAHKQTLTGGNFSPIGVQVALPADMRYEEQIIPEGATVYVLGFARPTLGETKTLREHTQERLRRLKQNKAALQHFDKNGDGTIDSLEWDLARMDVEQKALEETLSRKNDSQQAPASVSIGKPEVRGLPFVISESSEERMTQGYVWAMVALAAGTILSVLLGVLLLAGVLSFI